MSAYNPERTCRWDTAPKSCGTSWDGSRAWDPVNRSPLYGRNSPDTLRASTSPSRSRLFPTSARYKYGIRVNPSSGGRGEVSARPILFHRETDEIDDHSP